MLGLEADFMTDEAKIRSNTERIARIFNNVWCKTSVER
jgi:hypothetical protein